MGVIFPGDEFAYTPGGASRLRLPMRTKAPKATPVAARSLLNATAAVPAYTPPTPAAPVAPPSPPQAATTMSPMSVGGHALAMPQPEVDALPAARPRPQRLHLRALKPEAAETAIATEAVAPAQAAVPAQPPVATEPVASPQIATSRRRYRVPALLAAVVVIVAGAAYVVGTKTAPVAPARAVASAKPAEVAAADAASVETPVSFTDTFEVGAERSYTMTLSGSTATTLTLKVVATMEDGSALFDLTAGEERARLTVSPEGRVASVDGEAGPFAALGDPVDQTALQLLFPLLPGKAVKTGDTWGDNDVHAQIPSTDQVVAVNTAVTHDGGTENDTKLAQVIDVPVDLNIAGEAWSGTLHMTSTLHMVPSTGEVTQLVGNVVQHLTRNGTPLDATLKITLAPAAG